jgi:hypothetical protein
VIDENHPDFEPTSLPLTEQLKYWAKRNEIERIAAEARKVANEQFTNDINTMRILAARKGPNASAPYNPEID